MDYIWALFIAIALLQLPIEISGEEATNVNSEVELFKTLYIKKRIEHKEAIKSIESYADYTKQYKIIEVICERSFGVLQSSQVKLRENGYIPGMEFPVEENMKEALALLLETTAFMSELVLHFPDICHEILSKHQDSQLSLTWGILFASQSSFLDESSKKLVYLVSQELGLAEVDPNYTNPYAKSSAENPKDTKVPPKKPRKTFKKGPRMSNEL